MSFVFLVECVGMAEAQQPKKVPRIGFLSRASPAALSARVEAFRQGLRDLGYLEQKNVLIEYRYAEGRRDRMAKLAAELAGLKVDVIVAAGGNTLARALKKATNTIPIVMMGGSDPVAAGLIASLARPGGNITGVTAIATELAGKRLELLKEAVPKLSRVAVLYDVGNPPKIMEFNETQTAARGLGVKIQSLEVRSPDDFETAFQAAATAQTHALITLQSPLTVNHGKQIGDLALKGRLPMMVAGRGLLDAGGLMSYGPNFADLWRRAAYYVDRILKGAKPADLPVEQPMKFELIINLKAARQIGLTIPPNVLARADRVIR